MLDEHVPIEWYKKPKKKPCFRKNRHDLRNEQLALVDFQFSILLKEKKKKNKIAKNL